MVDEVTSPERQIGLCMSFAVLHTNRTHWFEHVSMEHFKLSRHPFYTSTAEFKCYQSTMKRPRMCTHFKWK